MPFFTQISSSYYSLASASLVLNPVDRCAVLEGWHGLYIYLPSSLKSIKTTKEICVEEYIHQIPEKQRRVTADQKLEVFLFLFFKDGKHIEMD